MPRITLFLSHLWNYAENKKNVYCHEVRLTFLHELGHYLGWDEEEVEAYGPSFQCDSQNSEFP